MNKDPILTEKSKEIKHQLLPGNFKTLVDSILDRTSHLVQKLSRNSQPPSSIYSALLISLSALLIDLLVSLLSGEFRFENRRQFIPIEILMVGMIFTLLVTLRMYFSFLSKVFRDRLIDNIQDITDLIDLQLWLTKISNPKRTALFSMFFAICGFGYFFVPVVALGQLRSSSIGALIMGGMLFFAIGMATYYLLYILRLSLNLGGYDFKVFVLDPRNSEIIEDISSLVTTFVYLIAAFLAVVTTVLVLTGWATLPAITPVTIVTWFLVVTLYAVNHYSLAKIITKAKWKTLNSIQMQIETIHNQGHLAQKETAEAIDRLVNYYDRIRSTSNSALNFRAGLNFVNSLLLPLLAFLLSNLKGLIQLIAK